MSRQLIDELTDASIRKLARYLRTPFHFDPARPPEAWLREQESKMGELPSVCLRPSGDALDIMSLVKRGLMKVSEKKALPFLPDAAVLCRTHRGLDPWRIRSLFALLASEVVEKLERLRRLVRNDSDLAQSSGFRLFVRRLTSVQALWMEADAFEWLWGHPPIGTRRVASQCEACILAFVGGDPVVLGDLRAHLLARTHQGTPILLRVVEAWLDASSGELEHIYTSSAVFGEELRRVRNEVARRRYQRRQRRREAAKSLPNRRAKHDDESGISSHLRSRDSSSGARNPVSGRSLVSPAQTSRRPAGGDRSGRPSTSNSSNSHHRRGNYVPDAYSHHLTAAHPPRTSGAGEGGGRGGRIPNAGPFGNEYGDDDDVEDTDLEAVGYDDDDDDDVEGAEGPQGMQQLGEFYERRAARGRGGRAFDESSLHPAFRRHSGSRSVVDEQQQQQLQQSQHSGFDIDPPRRSPRPDFAAFLDNQALWEDATVHSFSRSSPSQPSRTQSRQPPPPPPAAQQQSPQPQAQLLPLAAAAAAAEAAEASTTSSVYSIPASMARRETRARSEFQQMAAAVASSGTRRRQSSGGSSSNGSDRSSTGGSESNPQIQQAILASLKETSANGNLLHPSTASSSIITNSSNNNNNNNNRNNNGTNSSSNRQDSSSQPPAERSFDDATGDRPHTHTHTADPATASQASRPVAPPPRRRHRNDKRQGGGGGGGEEVEEEREAADTAREAWESRFSRLSLQHEHHDHSAERRGTRRGDDGTSTSTSTGTARRGAQTNRPDRSLPSPAPALAPAGDARLPTEGGPGGGTEPVWDSVRAWLRDSADAYDDDASTVRSGFTYNNTPPRF